MTDNTKKDGLGWKMWTGIGASFLYAGVAVLILAMNLGCSPFTSPMKLNEIGDYLAGAFSPLAFLWLVIGYVMQNRELGINRKVLEQQVVEFQKSLGISEGTLTHQVKKTLQEDERVTFENQPLFEILNSFDGFISQNKDKKLEIKIKNRKKDAYDFYLVLGDNFKNKKSNIISVFGRDETAVLTIDIKISDLVSDAIDILNENEQEGNDVFFGFVSFGEICFFILITQV